MRPRTLVLLALVLGACTQRGERTGTRPPLPLTDRTPYQIAPLPEQVLEEREVHRRVRYRRLSLRLAPRPGPDLSHLPGALEPLQIHHYRPDVDPGQRAPAVLILPILGNTTLLVDRFAADLAARGIHGVILMRRDLDAPGSLDGAEEDARLAIRRGRQAVAWLRARADVDPLRMGTLGISAGAILGVMIAATEPDLRAHVWMLGGGALADVVVESKEPSLRRDLAALEAQGISPETVRQRLARTLESDPLHLARHVNPAGVLMVLARRDKTVPIARGEQLWEGLGRPRLHTTPFNHYTTWVLLPWLMQISREHFRHRFR